MNYVVEVPGVGGFEFAFPSTASAFAEALGVTVRRLI